MKLLCALGAFFLLSNTVHADSFWRCMKKSGVMTNCRSHFGSVGISKIEAVETLDLFKAIRRFKINGKLVRGQKLIVQRSSDPGYVLVHHWKGTAKNSAYRFYACRSRCNR